MGGALRLRVALRAIGATLLKSERVTGAGKLSRAIVTESNKHRLCVDLEGGQGPLWRCGRPLFKDLHFRFLRTRCASKCRMPHRVTISEGPLSGGRKLRRTKAWGSDEYN